MSSYENEPAIHFDGHRFSQLRLHVAANATECLKPCAVRRTVISTFAARGVCEFIVFIVGGNMIQLDQHLPTEFVVVVVTVGDSPLEEVRVLDGFKRELRFVFLLQQKIHDRDLTANLILHGEVFLIRSEQHNNWIYFQSCPTTEKNSP